MFAAAGRPLMGGISEGRSTTDRAPASLIAATTASRSGYFAAPSMTPVGAQTSS